MRVRRSHYELAFERYLERRGTPFVAVEDVRHLTKGRTGIKAFDYIVYPVGGPACMVDVKGRKSVLAARTADWRQKNWVTRPDVDGLLAWQEVFGADYVALFAFAYWLVGGPEEDPPCGGGAKGPIHTFAGRRYSFWLVRVADYAEYQRTLSTSWDTISVPRAVFRRISVRLEQAWPTAPC